jgi:hypothetical protein
MRPAAIPFLVIHLLLAVWLADLKLSPNPTSRALPVLSLVEHGTLRIDAFHEATEDKALVDGHYYSEKAPLTSFLVLPFYFGLERVGLVPASPTGRAHLVIFLGVLLCGALPFAIVITLAYRSIAITSIPSGIPRALLASLPFYGSFFFVYSGVFYGHWVAALLLLLSWFALQRGDAAGDAGAGAAIGLATLAEYTTLVALLPWAVHLLVSRQRPAHSLVWLGLGGIPCAGALLLYNYATTGSPFDFLYSHPVEAEFQPMAQQLGFRPFAPWALAEALWGLVLSPFRGVVFFAPPALLMAALYVRSAGRRPAAWLHPLSLLGISYLLLVGSYYMWWGGWSYGPRHLLPPLAVLFFEGVGLLARSRFPRAVFYGLCGVGLAFALAAKVTAGELVPSEFSNPLLDFVLWNFVTGEVSDHLAATLALGLSAWWVLGVWGAGFAASLTWLVRREKAGP